MHGLSCFNFEVAFIIFIGFVSFLWSLHILIKKLAAARGSIECKVCRSDIKKKGKAMQNEKSQVREIELTQFIKRRLVRFVSSLAISSALASILYMLLFLFK